MFDWVWLRTYQDISTHQTTYMGVTQAVCQEICPIIMHNYIVTKNEQLTEQLTEHNTKKLIALGQNN